jgi:hypothetical protein
LHTTHPIPEGPTEGNISKCPKIEEGSEIKKYHPLYDTPNLSQQI